jgi:hypothetical protein
VFSTSHEPPPYTQVSDGRNNLITHEIHEYVPRMTVCLAAALRRLASFSLSVMISSPQDFADSSIDLGPKASDDWVYKTIVESGIVLLASVFFLDATLCDAATEWQLV